MLHLLSLALVQRPQLPEPHTGANTVPQPGIGGQSSSGGVVPEAVGGSNGSLRRLHLAAFLPSLSFTRALAADVCLRLLDSHGVDENDASSSIAEGAPAVDAAAAAEDGARAIRASVLAAASSVHATYADADAAAAAVLAPVLRGVGAECMQGLLESALAAAAGALLLPAKSGSNSSFSSDASDGAASVHVTAAEGDDAHDFAVAAARVSSASSSNRSSSSSSVAPRSRPSSIARVLSAGGGRRDTALHASLAQAGAFRTPAAIAPATTAAALLDARRSKLVKLTISPARSSHSVSSSFAADDDDGDADAAAASAESGVYDGADTYEYACDDSALTSISSVNATSARPSCVATRSISASSSSRASAVLRVSSAGGGSRGAAVRASIVQSGAARTTVVSAPATTAAALLSLHRAQAVRLATPGQKVAQLRRLLDGTVDAVLADPASSAVLAEMRAMVGLALREGAARAVAGAGAGAIGAGDSALTAAATQRITLRTVALIVKLSLRAAGDVAVDAAVRALRAEDAPTAAAFEEVKSAADSCAANAKNAELDTTISRPSASDLKVGTAAPPSSAAAATASNVHSDLRRLLASRALRAAGAQESALWRGRLARLCRCAAYARGEQQRNAGRGKRRAGGDLLCAAEPGKLPRSGGMSVNNNSDDDDDAATWGTNVELCVRPSLSANSHRSRGAADCPQQLPARALLRSFNPTTASANSAAIGSGGRTSAAAYLQYSHVYAARSNSRSASAARARASLSPGTGAATTTMATASRSRALTALRAREAAADDAAAAATAGANGRRSQKQHHGLRSSSSSSTARGGSSDDGYVHADAGAASIAMVWSPLHGGGKGPSAGSTALSPAAVADGASARGPRKTFAALLSAATGRPLAAAPAASTSLRLFVSPLHPPSSSGPSPRTQRLTACSGSGVASVSAWAEGQVLHTEMAPVASAAESESGSSNGAACGGRGCDTSAEAASAHLAVAATASGGGRASAVFTSLSRAPPPLGAAVGGAAAAPPPLNKARVAISTDVAVFARLLHSSRLSSGISLLGDRDAAVSAERGASEAKHALPPLPVLLLRGAAAGYASAPRTLAADAARTAAAARLAPAQIRLVGRCAVAPRGGPAAPPPVRPPPVVCVPGGEEGRTAAPRRLPSVPPPSHAAVASAAAPAAVATAERHLESW